MSLEAAIFALADAIVYATNRAFGPPKPQPFTINLESERRENDMDILTYRVQLAAVPSGTDVVTQTLVVSVGGEARPAVTLAPDELEHVFEVPQDSEVSLSLTHTDDAGNVSPARTHSFTANDTLSPNTPDGFESVSLIGERTE